jgi:predicted CxxxxCH...CXXCH cytochrome family protein
MITRRLAKMRCARFAITERFWLVSMLLACACGVVRPTDFAPQCPSYENVVSPVLQTRCARCHSAEVDAGYQVTSYRLALQRSDEDVQRVVAGDAQSPFLQAVRGELTGHAALSDEEQTLFTRWVVGCRASPDPTQFHPPGWANPNDTDRFHGTELRDAGYITFTCQECHGTDLRGGTSKVDCQSCHTQGVFACNTCHGDETSAAPPKALNGSRSRTTLGVGAHRQHVTDGPLHHAIACEACHPSIKNAEDEGHYRFAGAFIADRPVVILSSSPGQSARWSREAATCTNASCHAPNPADLQALTPVANWVSVTKENGTCGSCHGLGPTGHVSTRCSACHTPGYADGGVDLAVHVNGRIDFGAADDCGVCHSPPGSRTFTTISGRPDLGAHQAHLGAGTLRGPLDCGDCHLVPKRAYDPGHADSPLPAEVFPPGWVGGLARADSAPVGYNATAQTCTNYCHGSGAALVKADQTVGLKRSPNWFSGPAQAACGSCHGTPPEDGTLGHSIATSLSTCSSCHGLSVNSDGTIRFFSTADGGSTSFHINGVVNANTEFSR